jgi:V/A-type H+-transporting ATPase subunit E
MSGEALKLEIRKGAQDRANLVLTEAKAKADQILSEASTEAKRTLESRTQDAQRRLEQVERSEAAKARMECTRKVLGLQSKYVEQAFSEAESKLRALPTAEPARYKAALTRFIAEGSDALSGASLMVVVRDADRKLVEGILQTAVGARAERISLSSESLKSSGGIVIKTEDERGYYVNTFESRLLKAREELRAKVTDALLRSGSQ